jgi:hypothetical protein
VRHIQGAKETVYETLREAIKAANPARVATIAGVERTAIALAGAMTAAQDADIAGVFYLTFSGLTVTASKSGVAGAVTVSLECDVAYSMEASQVGAADLEQQMSAMDEELLAACPATAALMEQVNGVATAVAGAAVEWSYPVFALVKADGARRRRSAKLMVTIVDAAQNAS